MQQTRTLITGGAGFIGSHLCTELLKRGHHVLCLDNFSTGSRENIHHLTAHPHFDVIFHDISFPLFIEVDEIYDVSGMAPLQGRELAMQLKCKLVSISNIEIFNIYGPRMPQKEVLSELIMRALKGDPITLNEEDKESYSFCYIDDLIQGLIRLMESEDKALLCHPENHPLAHWSNRIIELTRSESKIILKKESSTDPLQEKINCQPNVPLERALLKTIEYFKQRMHYTTQLI